MDRRMVPTTSMTLAVLALVMAHTAHAQYGYGISQDSDPASELLQKALSVASTTIEVPLLDYSCSQSADQCCQYSSSVAECSSTANKNKGCRSHNKCVPVEDPCWGVSNRTSCLALASYCRFDLATASCAMDVTRHPCATILTTDLCSSTVSCRVQHTCQDVCSNCQECLEGAQAFADIPGIIENIGLDVSLTSEAEAFFRGFCLASTKGAEPARRAEILAGCRQIIADANRSPGLLQRPGALCTRLGICQAGCRVAATGTEGPGSSSSSGSYQAISMCSATGLEDAPDAGLVPSEPEQVSPESCVSSKDCPAGQECDTFTEATCMETCDPATGLDKCIAAGSCVNVCERPDIKAAVQESERRLRICDSTESCGQEEVCRAPTFECHTVTCQASNVAEGRDPIAMVPCPSICWPTKPRMLSAAFANDGNSIQVKLNQEAAPLDSLCLNIFDSETTLRIGALSTCTTEGDTLTIWLAGYVNIRPGEGTLRIGDDNLLLVPAFGDDGAVFSGGLDEGAAVTSCSDCSSTSVYVRVKGPSEIAMPCAPSLFLSDSSADEDNSSSADSADDVNAAASSVDSSGAFTFSALLPTDSIWMIDDIAWRVVEPAGVQALEELVNATNGQSYIWDKQLLSIPVAALPSIPEGPVTLEASVKNLFGVTSSSQLQFTKKSSTEAPVFELDKSQTQFHPADGFQLEARPKAMQCRNTRTIWTWSSDIPGVQLGATSTGASILLAAWDLLGNVQAGKDYNVTLTAQYEGSNAQSSDTVTLTAVGSPLSVQLLGPSGTAPLLEGNLTFDAVSASFDPDDPNNSAGQMAFLWKCQNEVDRSPCFGDVEDGILTIDPSQLRAGQQYTISVTAAKDSRNGTSSLTFTPMAKPLPSGIVSRSCGINLSTGRSLDCPALHNPTDHLTLTVQPDMQYRTSDVQWWYDPVAVPGIVLNDENTATGTNFQTLVILPEALPSGGSVKVNVNLTMENEDGELVTGLQSITVPLNSAPYCTQPQTSSCIKLDKTTSTFPDNEFQIGSGGWADPENSTLTYEFGIYTVFGPQLLAAGSSPAYSISGLLPGDNRLYVCAVDSFGAKGCQETIATVNEPETNLDDEHMEQQVLQIDLPFLDDTQDYSSMVNAAMKIASMLTYSTGKSALHDALAGNSPGSHLHHLKESSTAAKDSAPLAGSAAVGNSTNWLLKIMSGVGLGGAQSSPDKMNGLLSAGARLGSSGNLNADGGRSLLQLFGNTMAANKNSGKTISEPQTNIFANALSRGLVAAALGKPSEGASPSSSQSTDGSKASTEDLKIAAPLENVTVTPPPELTPEAKAKLEELKKQGHARASAHVPPQGYVATPDEDYPNRRRRSLLSLAVDKSRATAAGASSGNATKGLLSSIEAFNTLQDGAFNLSALQNVALGGAAKVAGNAAVCVGPALLPQTAVDGFSINFTCPGITVPSKVTLPQAFSESCRDSSSCSGNVLVWSTYYSPEGDGVNHIMGAVKQYPHLLSEDRNLSATLVSGVMNVTLNYSGPAGAFCSNPSTVDDYNSGCSAHLQLPLNDLFDAAKSHACVQLTPGAPGLDASRTLPVANITQSVVSVAVAGSDLRRAATVTLASCLADRQGLFAIVQYDGPALPSPGHAARDLDTAIFSSEQVELDAAHAQLYQFTFDLDFEALAADVDAVSEFKAELQRALLAGIDALWSSGPSLADATGALRLGHVTVNSLKAGSVVADVVFVPPVGTTPEQLAELAALVPADLIAGSDGLRERLMRAELIGTSPAAATSGADDREQSSDKGRMSAGAIAGVVVGCVVALATIVILVAVVAKGKASGTAHVPASAATSSAGAAANGGGVPAAGGDKSQTPVKQAEGPSQAAGVAAGVAASADDEGQDSHVASPLRQAAQL